MSRKFQTLVLVSCKVLTVAGVLAFTLPADAHNALATAVGGSPTYCHDFDGACGGNVGCENVTRPYCNMEGTAPNANNKCEETKNQTKSCDSTSEHCTGKVKACVK